MTLLQRKSKAKRRAKHLQTRNDILVSARACYNTEPEKKRTTERERYQAEPEKKRLCACVCVRVFANGEGFGQIKERYLIATHKHTYMHTHMQTHAPFAVLVLFVWLLFTYNLKYF